MSQSTELPQPQASEPVVSDQERSAQDSTTTQEASVSVPAVAATAGPHEGVGDGRLGEFSRSGESEAGRATPEASEDVADRIGAADERAGESVAATHDLTHEVTEEATDEVTTTPAEPTSPSDGVAEPAAQEEDAPSADSGGDDVSAGAAGTAAGRAEGAGGSRRARLAVLEREGEVAADFLERLLDIADLDGDIDVDVDGDRAAVAIVDSDEGRVPRRLVGPDGRVLEALQELTRLAVQTATGERSRLMLDVAGYRAERRAALVELARAAIGDVRDSGEAKALSNMTAFERKVVHDEVTAAGLASESEGVEPHRHIVIRLA